MALIVKLRCLSCKEEYISTDAGTCKECYEEASETEEERKRENEELKAKVAFLRLSSPLDSHYRSSAASGFTDVVLVASDDYDSNPVSVPAHKAVLAARSPVFKAMLETKMEESLSGTIKISDVSYDALRAFVNYFYTAETSCLDEQMAYELLVLAEKYQVKHLKSHCDKFLVSNLKLDNAITNFGFAHQHNAQNLLTSSLCMVTENMEKLTKTEEYSQLVERDAKLVVEIFEAYLSKQVNTAAKD